MPQTKHPIEIKAIKTSRSVEYGPNGSYTAKIYYEGKYAFTLFEPGTGGCLMHEDIKKPVYENLNRYFDETVLPEQPKLKMFNQEMDNDLDLFLADLVDQAKEDKTLKRWCRTKVVVILKGAKKGEYCLYKTKYTPEVAAKIREQNPDVVEIVNERFIA
jgi:hypothetical protein